MYTKSSLLQKSLTQLGFEKLEIDIYLELLETKTLNIRSLASTFATNRMRIYAILDRLQEQGLLTYTKGVGRSFALESPTKILGLLKFQETEARRLTSDYSNYLPDLLTNFFSSTNKPIIKVYEGKTQFLGIFNQILDESNPGDEILDIGEGEDFNEIIYIDYFKEWMRKRIQKNIKVRILGRQNNSFLKEIEPKNDLELRQLKFLPAEFKLTDGNLFILKNKIIIWNTVQVQAVVIENKAIADFFRSIFEGLWANA